MEAALDGRANPGAVYDVTYRIARGGDGAVRTIHAVAEVRRDPDGTPRMLIGSVADVTDRSAAEAAAILDTTPKAIDNRLYRARNLLRDRLKAYCPNPPSA